MLLTNLANDLDHIGCTGRGVDLGSGTLCLFSELRQKAIELVGDVGLDSLELDAKLLEVDFFERTIAGATPILLVGADIAREIGIMQRLFIALAEGKFVFESRRCVRRGRGGSCE